MVRNTNNTIKVTKIKIIAHIWFAEWNEISVYLLQINKNVYSFLVTERMHVSTRVYVMCRLNFRHEKLGTVLIDVEIRNRVTKAYAHLSFGGSMLTNDLEFLFYFF